MSNTTGALKETGTAYFSGAPEYTPGFVVVRIAHLLIFFMLFYFVSLRF